MNEVGALEHPMLHKLLVHAVQSSNFETVTHMLSCYLAMGMRPQTGWSDQNGMTILHWAALCGIPSILRVLRLTCPEADHLWESAKGPGPGFLTPADMLTERVKLLNDVQSCRPAQRVPATEIDIRFPITIPVLPFLLLFMAFCLEPQLSEVLAWITLMVLVAYPEYMLRSGIWCIRKRIHKQMSSIAEHHQPGLEVGRIWLVLSDQVVDVAYTNEWSRHVRWYDGFIAYAYVMKLAFMSLRPGAAWLMPLGSPIAAVLISRCFQSQSPRTREITNIVLAVYCWAYYYFASTFQLNDSDDTANYVTHVTCSSVLSSTLCAFFLSVQFSSIFPFRMRRCCLAGMVYFVVVLLGTQWRLLACGGSQVFRQGLLDWLCRSIFHSISPALWAAVGAELPCRLMERQRLGAFLAKYMKQA